MNILLVYPEHPDTFWSFKHALGFISKKAAVPPLGLITVSAMLPSWWNKKLVDTNISPLQDEELKWADYIFISAMNVQLNSVLNIIKKSKYHGKKIVAGGPLFTQEYRNFPDIDHFILNEAEITLQPFIEDLLAGKKPKTIYKSQEYAEMKSSPVPDYHLLSLNDYAVMNFQVSRGCPYACDFCEITTLLGHKVRMKEPTQVLEELQTLYDLKWRGAISIVDDNFVGNLRQAKFELLPAMQEWMHNRKHPFVFSAQTTITIADDDELLDLMVRTGFVSAFIGIETPADESLAECHKIQNQHRDLLASVKKIQKAGMQVSGGFIVGFDSDTTDVFQKQIDFIQQSGIVSAMVGLLNAPKNTRLYNRLSEEKRLTVDPTGSNTDMTMNFIPKMDKSELLKGYTRIIQNIYAVKPYYKRVRKLISNQSKHTFGKNTLKPGYLGAFFKSLFLLGMLKKGRSAFWCLVIWTLFNKPAQLVDVIVFTVYGYHYRTIYNVKNLK